MAAGTSAIGVLRRDPASVVGDLEHGAISLAAHRDAHVARLRVRFDVAQGLLSRPVEQGLGFGCERRVGCVQLRVDALRA